MKPILVIFRKELQAYFFSPLSYLFIIVFLVSISWIFFQDVFLVGQATMRGFFDLLPFFFLFLLPALSMRIWSEEKKTGTFETLLTLPISDRSIVLGKFMAAVAVLLVLLLLSLSIPFTLESIGSLDWGSTLSGYLGALCLGAAYLAVGQWLSSLTKNQIIAFLLTVVVMFVLMFTGLPIFIRSVGLAADLFTFISTQSHYVGFTKGVISLADITYFLSLIGLSLYLNVRSVENRSDI